MGIIDDLINAVLDRFKDQTENAAIQRAERNPNLTEAERQQVRESENPEETLTAIRQEDDGGFGPDRASELGEEFLSGFFDTFEDDVLENIEDGEPLTPENIEDKLNEAEGAALEDAVGIVAALLGIEIAGGTQLETHEEAITQIATFLTLEDTLGRRLGMAYEKGVDPALEAEIGKNTRSEFVSLQDAVEYTLRNKEADDGFLSGENVDQSAIDLIGSNEPVNPENLIEEWGIRDDQLPILEEVAIREMEPEELLETPAEAGVFVDEELLRDEMDRAGVSEGVKDLFEETAARLPRTTRAYEERPRAEETIRQLDSLVEAGEVSPEEAVELLPELPDPTVEELSARFEILADLPNGAPTRAQVEAGFTNGLIGIDRYLELIDQVDIDPEAHPYAVEEPILSELDGDLRTAVGLGLIEPGQFVELAELVGLEESIIDRLLQGEDLAEIAESRLQDTQEQETFPVDVVSGIGDSRRQTLEAAGVETVGQLAQSDVEAVTGVLNVADSTAEGFISRARSLTQS